MNGTLKDYLERREVEVYSDSRISYIKGVKSECKLLNYLLGIIAGYC